ncbi:MAG: hypothetical protein VW455_11815 [Nitrospinota bacterium]
MINLIKEKGSLFVLILFTLMFFRPTLSYSDDPDFQGLKPGQGRDQVLENCTVCHSAAIILQNHMTRKKWDQTLTWMQEKQGLWDLEPPLRKKILDYLSTYQGPKNSTNQNPLGHKYTYKPNPL